MFAAIGTTWCQMPPPSPSKKTTATVSMALDRWEKDDMAHCAPANPWGNVPPLGPCPTAPRTEEGTEAVPCLLPLGEAEWRSSASMSTTAGCLQPAVPGRGEGVDHETDPHGEMTPAMTMSSAPGVEGSKARRMRPRLLMPTAGFKPLSMKLPCRDSHVAFH